MMRFFFYVFIFILADSWCLLSAVPIDPARCTCQPFPIRPRFYRIKIDYVCCSNETANDIQLIEVVQLLVMNEITVDQFVLSGLDPTPLFNTVDGMLSIQTLTIVNFIQDDHPTWINMTHLTIRELRMIDCRTDFIFLQQLRDRLRSLENVYLSNYIIGDKNPRQGFVLFDRPFGREHFLMSLSLVRCRIESLRNVDLVRHSPSIRMLSLAHNQLEKIDNVHFFPQESFEFWHLDLSFNRLQTLPDDLYLPSTLTHLHLEENQIIRLPDNLFRLRLAEFWFQNNIQDCDKVKQAFGENLPAIFICTMPKNMPTTSSTTVKANWTRSQKNNTSIIWKFYK